MEKMDNNILLNLAKLLHAHYRQSPPSHKGWHADCPFCGKPAKRGQKHFFFNERGYICWVCQRQGGLFSLAQELHMLAPETGGRLSLPQAPKEKVAPPSCFDLRLLKEYEASPQKNALWASYKPLTPATIEKYRLGVGCLPKGKKGETRLIIPILRDGQLVMLRGRSLPGISAHTPKWLTNGTPPRLFGQLDAPPDATLVICENMADALWLNQEYPSLYALAPSGGAASWQAGWGKVINHMQPDFVLILLDNDPAGRLGASKIGRSLHAYRVPYSIFDWNKIPDAPPKADLGWLIEYKGIRL
jgi:hypothetical protein